MTLDFSNLFVIDKTFERGAIIVCKLNDVGKYVIPSARLRFCIIWLIQHIPTAINSRMTVTENMQI